MFYFDFNWQIQQFLNQFWWPINFGLVIVLGILIYLSFKKPLHAVILTIVFLPTYLFRSYIWFLPTTFLEICILITFIGWLISAYGRWHMANNKSPMANLKIFLWPIILILIAATISVFIAPNLRTAAGLWKAYFVEPILFFIVLVNVAKTEKDKEKIFWALGISALIISALAVFQKFTGFGIAEPVWLNPLHRRVTSIFTSPNAVGLYLGPIFVIYLGMLINNLKKINVIPAPLFVIPAKAGIQFIFLILMSLAIIFTKSEGTYLGVLAGIWFLLFFGWSKKLTLIVSLILIFICLAALPFLPNIYHKILQTATFQDVSGQNRLALWQGSLNYLTASAKNFVFGAGIFGFPKIQEQFRNPLQMESLIYPHNIILNFWLELGLLGLLGFVWLIIKFFKLGFKNNSKFKVQSSKLFIMAAMTVILIHGLVDVPYFKNDLAILFWLIIGLVI